MSGRPPAPEIPHKDRQTTMQMKFVLGWQRPKAHRIFWPTLILLLFFLDAGTYGAMLLKDYVVRYDRGWDILCDPYQVQQGDWVLKIFRQKGEIAHEDFREFLGIFERLNPQVKDIDRIRPGQVVDIPLKKLAQGNFPGQSTGVVTIPFVMISNPRELLEKHTRTYSIQQGDTVSQLIAKQFGGRYGNLTYNQGLKLFQAMNPQVKDTNRIYAGQKIYMPDPSIRQQSWYADLFDAEGNLTDKQAPAQTAAAASPRPAAAQGPQRAPVSAAAASSGPTAGAAAAMGGRLLDKGTYFLPMKQGGDFELDLSRFPMIDLQNGSKVILSTQDQVMNVDLPLIQAYWDNVKVAKIPENASAEEILGAVLATISDGKGTTNRLAFDDGAAFISVTAKWIQSGPSADGSKPHHICITPITSAAQRTNQAIVRYLDQNDISIQEVLSGASDMSPATVSMKNGSDVSHIDGSNQRALVESFARSMAFHYSPHTSISFPYAGIQVQALSNLLSFGKGKELLVDFGDLYGDAIKAIKETGLDIIQIKADAGALDILQRLMETAGLGYTRSPVFYGADRPANFNTAITVNGLLIPTGNGENRLFFEMQIPELIERFINDQGIQLVRIDTTSNSNRQ
jgi:hypothetical protein